MSGPCAKPPLRPLEAMRESVVETVPRRGYNSKTKAKTHVNPKKLHSFVRFICSVQNFYYICTFKLKLN